MLRLVFSLEHWSMQSYRSLQMTLCRRKPNKDAQIKSEFLVTSIKVTEWMVQCTVICALWVMRVMEIGVVLMVEMDGILRRRRGQEFRRAFKKRNSGWLYTTELMPENADKAKNRTHTLLNLWVQLKCTRFWGQSKKPRLKNKTRALSCLLLFPFDFLHPRW